MSFEKKYNNLYRRQNMHLQNEWAGKNRSAESEFVPVMVAEWVKVSAVWCDPWPEHVLGWWVRIQLGAWLVCVPV